MRAARPEEAATLRAIELDAARRFEALGLDFLSGVPPTSLELLRGAIEAGHVLVVAERERVLGFALVEPLGGALHLAELDVRADFSGQGLGRRLVEAVCDLARSRGYPRVTLTTFRDVPFNAPWYARLGFRVLDEGELEPHLAGLRAHERLAGLDALARVVMERRLE
ncbi:MAG: GNAT family N-acetyltransferase [Sandaracinaceae bacterium]|nr:GNAT family N-acetyltransferase [Sandaracinaceae bacterium]